jgi:hypothetical protein
MTITGIRSTALRVLLNIGVALGVAGTALVVLQTPAHATYADCASNMRLCAWDGADGNGTKFEWGGTWSGTCWNLIPSQDNKISSVYNRMPRRVTFYVDRNCPRGSTLSFVVESGQVKSAPDYPLNWQFDNTASSVFFD